MEFLNFLQEYLKYLRGDNFFNQLAPTKILIVVALLIEG
jgi:hypothetical protein